MPGRRLSFFGKRQETRLIYTIGVHAYIAVVCSRLTKYRGAVTEASSGLGLNVTESALNLATKYPSSQLLALKMDVTELEDVSKAFADAKAHFGTRRV